VLASSETSGERARSLSTSPRFRARARKGSSTASLRVSDLVWYASRARSLGGSQMEVSVVKGIRRTALVALTLLAMLAISVPPAEAHNVSNPANGETVIWQDGDAHCLKQRAEIRHLSGTIFEVHAIAHATAKIPSPYTSCTNTFAADWTPQRLRARWVLERRPSGGTWSLCQEISYVTVYSWSKLDVKKGFASRPCGAGDYRVIARSQVYFQGAWYPNGGGGLISGVHSF
jgi:hypothetical protein